MTDDWNWWDWGVALAMCLAAGIVMGLVLYVVEHSPAGHDVAVVASILAGIATWCTGMALRGKSW